MGMRIGCMKSGDAAFETKHNVIIKDVSEDKFSGNNIRIFFQEAYIESLFFELCRVKGDCTAASLWSECVDKDSFFKYLPIVLEYLSVNARISCFFSRKVDKKDIPYWLNELKKFHISGLHLQKSNRDPESNCYIITGIFKIPNPVINSYDKWSGQPYDDHNHFDVTKFNQINSEFNLPTL